MNPQILRPKNTVMLMIDVQEKLLPAIYGKESVELNAKKLIKASQAMEIPLKVTEQYPKGLGTTVPGLAEEISSDDVFEKKAFGCFDEEGFDDFFRCTRRNQVVLFGIESHICVHTTAMQLLERDFEVTVVADGCGSRKNGNHEIALRNMSACGVHVLPMESVVYQLIKVSGTPEFKQLLPLFK
ncbi:MAG: isochorismatase family protein [Synergistota bacterium]|nr:isochorismatase family protein [Synergistota bacterium]